MTDEAVADKCVRLIRASRSKHDRLHIEGVRIVANRRVIRNTVLVMQDV